MGRKHSTIPLIKTIIDKTNCSREVQLEIAHYKIQKGVCMYVYIPKSLGQNEEARETKRVGGVLEEESAAVAEIGGICARRVRLATEKAI